MEMELVRHEIERVDELIRIGQEMYDWNSPGENSSLYINYITLCYKNITLYYKNIEVPEYIDNLMNSVRKLHSRIFRAQENVGALLRMIYSWALSPILERKDFKSENLLALGERDENFQKRYGQIERAVRELNRVLDENYKLFFDLLPDLWYERDEFELDESNSYLPIVSKARLFCGTKQAFEKFVEYFFFKSVF